MKCAGVILAGGQSRRMGGGDKGLLPLAGRPMLSHVIMRLAPQVDGLALNANGDPHRFSDFGLTVIADPIEGFAGPLSGVLAGMNWAALQHPDASHIVTAAGDTPFFPEDLVERLTATANGNPDCVVLAGSGGHRHPVFGLWPVALRNDLAAWMTETETYKVLAWVRRHHNAVAEFPLHVTRSGPLDPFFNVNTREELAAAETCLQDLSS